MALRRLQESTFQPFRILREADHPQPQYPSDHQPGMRVPKGGSSCSNCEYLGQDGKTCKNKYFIKWNGSNVLPAPADSYCSDWWEPNG